MLSVAFAKAKNADNGRIVITRHDGPFERAHAGRWLPSPKLHPEDQVLYLP
jgi:hypothetical protein